MVAGCHSEGQVQRQPALADLWAARQQGEPFAQQSLHDPPDGSEALKTETHCREGYGIELRGLTVGLSCSVVAMAIPGNRLAQIVVAVQAADIIGVGRFEAHA